MANAGSAYRLLLEARLDPKTIEAQVRALESKGNLVLKVSIDPRKIQGDLQKILNSIQAQGGEIGKIKLFEGLDKGGNQGINRVLIDYKNNLGQAERTWAMINSEVQVTKTRTVDLAKIEKELLSLQTKSENLTAKQADEMARMTLGAEKFLAKSKSMSQTPAVIRAQTTATSIVNEKDINKMRDLNRIFQVQQAELKGAKGALRSWGDALASSAKQVLVYSMSAGALYTVLGKLREGLQYVVDLNKEMVKIQVLNIDGAKTSEEISNLAMGYNDLAKEMGLTTIEIAKGSVEFLRQGKTISQTYELLRSSLILSKLGNLESAQSTEYLTSIMNGFKLEIEDVASAVDKLIQLDNISASSSGEIATAMSYSAAVANQTGVSFDKLAAIITVASNTTRMAGEVIGQSLKTILTRLQGVAAGKAVDEFGEDLNQVEKVLRKVGIEIRDSATSFRPMGDVLDEVGEKWEQYDDTQRAQIATAIAGKIMPEHTVMCGLVN